MMLSDDPEVMKCGQEYAKKIARKISASVLAANDLHYLPELERLLLNDIPQTVENGLRHLANRFYMTLTTLKINNADCDKPSNLISILLGVEDYVMQRFQDLLTTKNTIISHNTLLCCRTRVPAKPEKWKQLILSDDPELLNCGREFTEKLVRALQQLFSTDKVLKDVSHILSAGVNYCLRMYPSQVRDVPSCRCYSLLLVREMGYTDIPILCRCHVDRNWDGFEERMVEDGIGIAVENGLRLIEDRLKDTLIALKFWSYEADQLLNLKPILLCSENYVMQTFKDLLTLDPPIISPNMALPISPTKSKRDLLQKTFKALDKELSERIHHTEIRDYLFGCGIIQSSDDRLITQIQEPDDKIRKILHILYASSADEIENMFLPKLKISHPDLAEKFKDTYRIMEKQPSSPPAFRPCLPCAIKSEVQIERIAQALRETISTNTYEDLKNKSISNKEKWQNIVDNQETHIIVIQALKTLYKDLYQQCQCLNIRDLNCTCNLLKLVCCGNAMPFGPPKASTPSVSYTDQQIQMPEDNLDENETLGGIEDGGRTNQEDNPDLPKGSVLITYPGCKYMFPTVEKYKEHLPKEEDLQMKAWPYESPPDQYEHGHTSSGPERKARARKRRPGSPSQCGQSSKYCELKQALAVHKRSRQASRICQVVEDQKLQSSSNVPEFAISITEERIERVQSPNMTYSAKTVNKDLQVKKDIILVNFEKSGQHDDDQLKLLEGVCCDPLPFPSSRSNIIYLETHNTIIALTGWSGISFGVCEEGTLDSHPLLFKQEQTWCVCIGKCPQHNGSICTKIWEGPGRQMGECSVDTLLPMTPSKGSKRVVKLALVVDIQKGRIGFIDLDREKVLYKFDCKFEEPLYPVFSIPTTPEVSRITMTLVTGSDVVFTDTKKSLICEALSD